MHDPIRRLCFLPDAKKLQKKSRLRKFESVFSDPLAFSNWDSNKRKFQARHKGIVSYQIPTKKQFSFKINSPGSFGYALISAELFFYTRQMSYISKTNDRK